MKAVEFCYWLQGFFELQGEDALDMTPKQVAQIRAHLALVFKHEIDPSYGLPEKQAELDKIHHKDVHPSQVWGHGEVKLDPKITYRC